MAKWLGWTEIECTVVGMSGLQAELAEIDENIIRTSRVWDCTGTVSVAIIAFSKEIKTFQAEQ